MGSGRRRGLTIDCIRAGFADREDGVENGFLGSIDVLTIDDGYGVDGIDGPRLCLYIDRHICAC
jgi:hypothetical protein